MMLGVMLLQVAIGPWLYDRGVPVPLTLTVMFAFAALAVLGFLAGKRVVTTPRIGMVEFGPERKVKNKRAMIFLSISLWIVPAGIFGVQAIVIFSLLAYFLDLSRLYLYGWLYALVFPGRIISVEYLGIRDAFAVLAPAAVMVIIGGVLFVRFLRRYPLSAEYRPAEGTPDGEAEPGGDPVAPLANIDRLIHEPARLLIMSYLYVVDSADFLFLSRQTGMTFGNLSSHMSKLEVAGYVEVEKKFVGKKPQTMLHLTQQGRAALERYRTGMRQMLDELPGAG
jgi:DNA-binding MarR family transcriptional regulator